MKAKIKENKLIIVLDGQEHCVATATNARRDKFRWYGLGRFGTGAFDTAEALRAAANRLGFKVS